MNRSMNKSIIHNVIINWTGILVGSFIDIIGRMYFNKDILKKMLSSISKVDPLKNMRICDIDKKFRIAIG